MIRYVSMLACYSLAALLCAAEQTCEKGSKDCCRLTQPAREGPFYLKDAPWRNDTLCPNSATHNRLTMHGRVTGPDCKTGVESVLDVWQADSHAEYSDGYKNYQCRGILRTDKDGYYKFSTVVPGRYVIRQGYRPAHIHFKVRPVEEKYVGITTQMYFENDEFLGPIDSCPNDSCHSDKPTLWAKVSPTADWKTFTAEFNFVLDVQQ